MTSLVANRSGPECGEFRYNGFLANDADGLVAQFAAAEVEQRRDALDAEARGERGLSRPHSPWR